MDHGLHSNADARGRGRRSLERGTNFINSQSVKPSNFEPTLVGLSCPCDFGVVLKVGEFGERTNLVPLLAPLDRLIHVEAPCSTNDNQIGIGLGLYRGHAFP